MAEKKEGREREGGEGKKKTLNECGGWWRGGRRKRGRVKKKMTDRKFRSAPNAQGSIL